MFPSEFFESWFLLCKHGLHPEEFIVHIVIPTLLLFCFEEVVKICQFTKRISFNGLIDFTDLSTYPCLEVKEACSLYVHIYILCNYSLRDFFVHKPICTLF